MYSKFEELLKKHGITAYRVAQETGVPTSTLSDWKRGRSVPKIDKLQKIAKYFDLPVTYFIDEKGR